MEENSWHLSCPDPIERISMIMVARGERFLNLRTRLSACSTTKKSIVLEV